MVTLNIPNFTVIDNRLNEKHHTSFIFSSSIYLLIIRYARQENLNYFRFNLEQFLRLTIKKLEHEIPKMKTNCQSCRLKIRPLINNQTNSEGSSNC